MLKTAAKSRKVPATEVLAATKAIENAKVDPSNFLQQIGGRSKRMLIFTVDQELVRIRSKKYPPNWWSWSTCSGHKSPPEMPPCSCNLSFLADNLKNTITPTPFYMPFFLRSKMHGVEVLEECSFLSLLFRVLMLWWVFNISSESPPLTFFQLQTKALFCMCVFLGMDVCVCVFCTGIQNTHTFVYMSGFFVCFFVLLQGW